MTYQKGTTYIFRWKAGLTGYPIAVTPSRGKTEEDVWEWAIKWLRGASERDDRKAENFIRNNGEVVKADDRQR